MKQLIIIAAVLLASYCSIAQDKQQCTGITKKGERCKITKVDNTGKCRIHSDKTVRCGQPTKTDGKPCRNIPKTGETNCHLHKSK
jgi:hypothetical protein